MPPLPAPLSKRIKRQVIARTQYFFAITTPWLEPVCRQELQALLPDTTGLQPADSGVMFQGRLTECYRANLHLRTANRILMRLARFKASNFRVLTRQLEEFPWELYLYKEHLPEYRIAAHQSRLYHRGAIVTCFAEALTRRLAAHGAPAPTEVPPSGSNARTSPCIFGRLTDDICLVSLDSSGVLLHKRGLKPQVGRAPLRETMAAGILHLAGYDPRRPLIDPFCGSGTFLLEAALISRHIPPGWFREFAFMQWPAFKPRHWAYLRQQTVSARRSTGLSPIIGLDKDAAALQALRTALEASTWLQDIQLQAADFFSFAPRALKLPPGLVVLNPPYGHRLREATPAPQLFQELCIKLNRDFKGWKYGLLAPRREWLTSLKGVRKQYVVGHGGLELVLVTGQV